MPSFGPSQIRRYAAQGAIHRAQLWAVSVTLAATTAPAYTFAKSPSGVTRTAQEQGAGYVERTIATFLVRKALALTISVGTEFTIRTSAINAAEEGTSWRVFDYTPGATREEDRCVCFKLD